MHFAFEISIPRIIFAEINIIPVISREIKSLAIALGADQCGIASIDRFDEAPDGFHPVDIYNKSRSVLVFLKRMPEEVIRSENAVLIQSWITPAAGAHIPARSAGRFARFYLA